MTRGILLRLVALAVVLAIIATLLRSPRESTDSSRAEANAVSKSINVPPRVLTPSPPQPAADKDTHSGTRLATAATNAPRSVDAPGAEGHPAGSTPELESPPHGAPPPPESAGAVTKPVPLLDLIEDTFKKSKSPDLMDSLQHRRDMEQEPENEWSEDMERRLRNYLAAQPEASRVLMQVACRASECLIQLADKVREPLVDGRVHAPSEAIFYRMQAETWFQQELQLYNSQLVAIDNRPFWVAFFDRKP